MQLIILAHNSMEPHLHIGDSYFPLLAIVFLGFIALVGTSVFYFWKRKKNI